MSGPLAFVLNAAVCDVHLDHEPIWFFTHSHDRGMTARGALKFRS